MALPRFVLLKSNANNKYLCHTRERLGFTYDGSNESEQDRKIITHSHLRFEIEKSKTVHGLVHIRSCYNNKYFVRNSIDSKCVAATGNEGEEDQSIWGCTLFKPIIVESESESKSSEVDDKSYKIRLLHASESRQLCVRTDISSSSHHLVGVEEEEPNEADLSSLFMFTAIDVESSAILPEYFTLMGPNNKYLTATDIPGLLSLFTFGNADVGSVGVAHRVPEQAAESTALIDNTTNKYWKLSTGGGAGRVPAGCLTLTESSSDATQFEAVKVDGSFTALRCKDNNLFVSFKGETLFVAVTEQNIVESAKLRVGEPVLSRTIKDATYDLEEARVYGGSSIEKFSDSRSNSTSVEQEGSFAVSYTTEQTSSWSQSTTVNIKIGVSWSAGIPYVGDMGVDISYEHGQTWESGGEVKNSKEVGYSQGIKIPPGKKVMLKVLARRACCDVPFTCTATDLMTDGTTRVYTLSGLYSGVNEFLFDTQITEQDI